MHSFQSHSVYFYNAVAIVTYAHKIIMRLRILQYVYRVRRYVVIPFQLHNMAMQLYVPFVYMYSHLFIVKKSTGYTLYCLGTSSYVHTHVATHVQSCSHIAYVLTCMQFTMSLTYVAQVKSSLLFYSRGDFVDHIYMKSFTNQTMPLTNQAALT